MKILLIHRYFWPDTPPYASMLRSIAKRLVEQGHEVVVLSSQPSYKLKAQQDKQLPVETVDGMEVHRISLFREKGRNVLFRLFNMIYFPLRVFIFSIFKGKFNVIMASTAPPVVVGLAAAISAKVTGAKFFYHCMDIHPEIGRISGEFKNPYVFKFLRKLDVISCNLASNVIVLSDDMKKSLSSRAGYYKKNIKIINNFSMPSHCANMDVDSELLKQPDRFRIIFAGNIGRFQGLEVFIDILKKMLHIPQIELVFIGEGGALDSIKERAADMSNVHFFPHQSVNVARKMIADADLGIVSLSPRVYKYAYPSKTMTYLEEGCPLLVSVEHDSELVSLIESSNIGIWVDLQQLDSVVATIKALYLNPDMRMQMKINAKKVYKKEFSESAVLDCWVRMFEADCGKYNG